MSFWTVQLLECKNCHKYSLLVVSGPCSPPCLNCQEEAGWIEHDISTHHTFLFPLADSIAEELLSTQASEDAEWFHRAMENKPSHRLLALVAKQTAIEAVIAYLVVLMSSPFSFNSRECREVVEILESARDI